MTKDRREKGLKVFTLMTVFHLKMISWKLDIKILPTLVFKRDE